MFSLQLALQNPSILEQLEHLSGRMFNFSAHGSSPPHLGLHYSMKNICRIYFALITFWRQCHHSWSSVLKLPKTQWKICAVFYTDWSRSISSPSILHLSSGSRVVWSIWHCTHCPYGQVCKQGNHWAIMNNAVSVTTCSHLSARLARLHSALHRAIKQQQISPTHSSHMTEKQISKGLPEAFANQYRLFSCSTLCPMILLERLWI